MKNKLLRVVKLEEKKKDEKESIAFFKPEDRGVLYKDNACTILFDESRRADFMVILPSNGR